MSNAQNAVSRSTCFAAEKKPKPCCKTTRKLHREEIPHGGSNAGELLLQLEECQALSCLFTRYNRSEHAIDIVQQQSAGERKAI